MRFLILTTSLICHLLGKVSSLGNDVANGPEQIHLSFGDRQDAMVVSWTSNETDPERLTVWYGEKETMTRRAEAFTRTYTAGGWKGYLHYATLLNLSDDSIYRYSVQNGSSDVYSFRTRSSLRKTTKIVAYGDMGTVGDANGPGANLTVDFCERSIANGTDFILHVGDIPYDKGDEWIWDSFFRGVQPVAARVPYMTCPGNEDHAYDFVGYLSRFRMPQSVKTSPNSSWFYSFDYERVHVLSISTEYIDREPGSAQYRFMEADLRAVNRSKTPFVVMIGHRPLYCSSNDYYDCNMWAPRARETLEPLMSRYGVDLYVPIRYSYTIPRRPLVHSHVTSRAQIYLRSRS